MMTLKIIGIVAIFLIASFIALGIISEAHDTINMRTNDHVYIAECEARKMMEENKTNGAKTADIVRCGECKHWFNEHQCLMWSRYGTLDVKCDDFCSLR